MDKTTKTVVETLKASMRSIRDLPVAIAGLYQFGLSDEQKDLAKNALRLYAVSLVFGNKKQQDLEAINQIENNYRRK